MNIPNNLLKSSEIDQETIIKYKSLANNYSIAFKRYIKSNISESSYRANVLSWFFNFPLEKRKILCSIENKWVTLVLYQMYSLELKDPKLRFCPKFNSQNNDIISNNPLNFSNYFYFKTEGYETNPKNNFMLSESFIPNIIFYYKSDIIPNINSSNYEDFQKDYYPFFTLSSNILKDKNNFIYYFSNLSNDKYFLKPININKNDIYLPFWCSQNENKQICFSVSEIYVAFFEQVISINYLLFLYDYKLTTTKLENIFTIKTELINYLNNIQNNNTNINCFDFLNIYQYSNEINNYPLLEKFIDIKNSYNNDKQLVWEDNLPFSKVITNLQFYFSYFNGLKHNEELIDKILFLNIFQLFKQEDYLFRKIFKLIYDNNSKDIAEDLINELESNSNTKKKKKKKKGKKDENNKNNQISNNNLLINNEIQLLNNKNNDDNLIIPYTNIDDDKEIYYPKNKNDELIDKINKESHNKITNKKYDTESFSIILPLISEIINLTLLEIDTIEYKKQTNVEINNKIEIVDNIKKKNNKKKEKGFFLYNTLKKQKEVVKNKIIPVTFMNKLNNDILLYNKNIDEVLNYMRPIKEYIIDKLKDFINICMNTISNNKAKYEIEVYGSFINTLDIECSDIDMIFKYKKKKNNDSTQLINIVSSYFISLQLFSKVNPIYTASIPIIKLEIDIQTFIQSNDDLTKFYNDFKLTEVYKNYIYDANELTNLNVDISFPITNNNSFNKNQPKLQIDYIKKSISLYKEIRPIIKIIKRILKLKYLNNPYIGGLSSYNIFLLILAYYKYKLIKNIDNLTTNTCNYSNFLIDMVQFFANFDFLNTEIDVRNDDPFYSLKNNSSNIPYIIDPTTSLNAGKSAFNILSIQKLFIHLNELINEMKLEYDTATSKDNANKDNLNKDILNTNLIELLIKKLM